MTFSRMSVPGNECNGCGAVMGESLACPGCNHVDPLTRPPRPAGQPRNGGDAETPPAVVLHGGFSDELVRSAHDVIRSSHHDAASCGNEAVHRLRALLGEPLCAHGLAPAPVSPAP